jgi:hypothetical protein
MWGFGWLGSSIPYELSTKPMFSKNTFLKKYQRGGIGSFYQCYAAHLMTLDVCVQASKKISHRCHTDKTQMALL